MLEVPKLMKLDCHAKLPKLPSHPSQKFRCVNSEILCIHIPEMEVLLSLWNFVRLDRGIKTKSIERAVRFYISPYKLRRLPHWS